ncbi:hypothetical protein BDR26DRAFT_912776 [Obelidium mucronatum]|nr:hypothetical protein BDR26DRAFT_912776 [Obelidium mucronatum]
MQSQTTYSRFRESQRQQRLDTFSFRPADIPSLESKSFLVTGGNAGLGFETCLQLAKKNAGLVLLAARSEERAEEAIGRIKAEVPGANVAFMKLDLGDLKQIDTAAKNLIARGVAIDVLVNNGGIYNTPFALSTDGIEETFAVNYVGHFHLTRSLLPGLHAAAPPGGILFDSINDPKVLNGVQRYAQSKLAMTLFTTSLNKRYGDSIYINSADPGYTATKMASKQSEGFLKWLDAIFLPLFGNSVLYGALTQIYLATSKEVAEKEFRGLYFSPVASQEKGFKSLSALAKDSELAEKLWYFTEQLIESCLNE